MQGACPTPRIFAYCQLRTLHQVVLGVPSVHRHFTGAVLQMEEGAIGIRGVPSPVFVTHGLYKHPVEMTRRFRDRRAHELVGRGFAVDSHQAHRKVADGEDGSAFKDFDFAEDFKSPKKRIETHAKEEEKKDHHSAPLTLTWSRL